MKSFLLVLAGALSLGSPGAAWALPGETVFTVVIPDGPDPGDATPAGQLRFELDAEIQGGCRYYAVWEGEGSSDASVEAGCWVDEMKMPGHTVCSANSRTTFTTMVQKTSKSRCSGFDSFAHHQDLFMLAGLEISSLDGVIGLIQYTAAAPWVYPFEAKPYP